MKLSVIFAVIFLLAGASTGACADKLRIAYVSPSVNMSAPWLAKELGILAKYDLAAEILLITGSPRLVQSLIAGDVEVADARQLRADTTWRPPMWLRNSGSRIWIRRVTTTPISRRFPSWKRHRCCPARRWNSL